MEKKDDAFDVKVSSDRTGNSEGIGLPTDSSIRPGENQFGAQSSSGTGNSAGGFGVTGASDFGGTSKAADSSFGIPSGTNLGSDIEFHECASCGERHVKGSDAQGFDKILSTVGLNDAAIEKMRASIENLDLDSYFNQAKEYLGDSATKAKQYAKDNKTLIGAALAVVAVGAGVLIAANRRSSSDQWVTPRIDDRDINRI